MARQPRPWSRVGDTTLADAITDDLNAISAGAVTAAVMLDAGDLTPQDTRAVLHKMRALINRAENRLDADVQERVRLARTPTSGHGNTRPPA